MNGYTAKANFYTLLNNKKEAISAINKLLEHVSPAFAYAYISYIYSYFQDTTEANINALKALKALNSEESTLINNILVVIANTFSYKSYQEAIKILVEDKKYKLNDEQKEPIFTKILNKLSSEYLEKLIKDVRPFIRPYFFNNLNSFAIYIRMDNTDDVVDIIFRCYVNDDDKLLDSLAECNFALQEFLVKWEDKNNINLGEINIFCEAEDVNHA